MVALPLEELRRQQSLIGLVPKTAGQLTTEKERIVARLQLLLNATIALALAGAALIAYLPFSPVPHEFRFGVQECWRSACSPSAFSSCTSAPNLRSACTTSNRSK